MGMSAFYGAIPSEEESIKLIHKAIELGVNFFDTSDVYGFGHNEELLGKAIKSSNVKRSDIIVATKFAIRRVNGKNEICGTPQYVKEACGASLKRLGLDYIDLYYQHRVDPNTPIEDTVGAMAELVKEGKVRALGLSECSAATLRRAHKIHPISAVQVEYSLWTTDPESNGLLDTCRELGVTFVSYSPLGRGFLTGAIKKFDDLEKDDWRRQIPRFQPENFAKNLELLQLVEDIAKTKGCTPSQFALAWVLRQPGVVAIPGTKKIKYLEENWAANKVTVTDEDDKKIRPFLSQFVVAGTRYPEANMKSVHL